MNFSSAAITRVPNLLMTQAAQARMTRTSIGLLQLTDQFTSGQRINRTSDDPISSSVVLTLDERIERTTQTLRNMSHADAVLGTLDQALSDAHDIVLEAVNVATSQLGVTSDSTTRAQQATVIDSLLRELASIANRQYTDIHVFGGTRAAASPVQDFLTGFRYGGDGEGLLTDLGDTIAVPITIGADKAFGALSERVEGSVDLNPQLTRSTTIGALRGARSLDVSLGVFEVDVFDGVTTTTATIDLSGARNVGDILDTMESTIRQVDPASVAGVYPSAGTAGEALQIPAAAGYTISFRDIGQGTTAADLGLSGFGFTSGGQVNPAGGLDPRLTEFTRLADLAPGTPIDFGDIQFRNGPQAGTVTVDPTMTVADLRAEVSRLGLGLRLTLGEDGRSIDVRNEVSGLSMAIEEAGGLTATTLGIRTFKPDTLLSVFNDGRGVEIAHGQVDPTTGLPDPARNVDFRITLQSGATFDVDLIPDDVLNVQTVLDAINAAAVGAGLAVPGDFEARLTTGANGIELVDNSGFVVDAFQVESLNGYAAEDLGLLDGTTTLGVPATIAGSDRAKVRVDSVLTDLIDLRDALQTNDERGITLAGERLQADLDRLSETRATVGARASRVGAAKRREEDQTLLDQTIRSNLADLDYAEASSRFALLELAQQAGLAATARVQSLSLLDFLG